MTEALARILIADDEADLRALLQRYLGDQGYAVRTVESAQPLDTAETERIRQELLSRFGSDITFEFRSNPSLLGGLRVQIGSDVWDGSVANRLHLLKQQL